MVTGIIKNYGCFFIVLSIKFQMLVTHFDQFMQPGYLRNLVPDSAPSQPESLQNVLDGEVS